AEARVQLGIALSRHGRMDASALQFETAARLAPENAHVVYSAGTYYLMMGDNRRALPYLERAAERAPDNALAHVNLGVAYLNTDNADGARKEFEDAVRLQPSLADAHLGLAMAYRTKAT